jgi:predicted phosphate transport protein (TIGR00153 family)
MFKEKDSKFFYLFETAATNVANAAQTLQNLTCDPTDKETKIDELEKLEHRGDELTHDIIAELHKAFITPIDREDIFLIAKETDNILDNIEATAHRFSMFNITKTNEAVQKMAKLIVASAHNLAEIMHDLRKINRIAIDNQLIVEINRLENEGDQIYRDAVKDLYSGDHDPLTVIKWREILDHLENTLDALEDVANIVEGIAMKNS